MAADHSEPVLLESGSVPIGVIADTIYDAYDYALDPHATVLIFSDGAYEMVLPGGGHGRLEEFIDLCTRTARSPDWSLDDLVDQLRKRSETGDFEDDCTLVRLTA
jgi:sigma-B regulation protein RsbU (phosphoserine phosphatase)